MWVVAALEYTDSDGLRGRAHVFTLSDRVLEPKRTVSDPRSCVEPLSYGTVEGEVKARLHPFTFFVEIL